MGATHATISSRTSWDLTLLIRNQFLTQRFRIVSIVVAYKKQYGPDLVRENHFKISNE